MTHVGKHKTCFWNYLRNLLVFSLVPSSFKYSILIINDLLTNEYIQNSTKAVRSTSEQQEMKSF